MTCSLRVSLLRAAAITLLLPILMTSARAEDEAPKASRLIDFTRDVQPILQARCLACHGPEEAKNDFRVDDSESLLAYIEPSDASNSSLWTDYLATEDADMLMPPATDDTHGGLPGNELAVLKMWIDEGAQWAWISNLEVKPVVDHQSPTASVPARVWTFAGLFHPASVHFPIALLLVSSLFVFLSFFDRKAFEPVAFHCLWIGALGAVATCAMGWSYAVHQGYGNSFSLDLMDSSIDRHRWLGISLAGLSLILVPIARSAGKTGSFSKRVVWFLGASLLAVGVSVVGYQGGELTYGEDHYFKEFDRLFPSAIVKTSSEPVAEGNDMSTAGAQTPAPLASPVVEDAEENSVLDPAPEPVVDGAVAAPATAVGADEAGTPDDGEDSAEAGATLPEDSPPVEQAADEPTPSVAEPTPADADAVESPDVQPEPERSETSPADVPPPTADEPAGEGSNS